MIWKVLAITETILLVLGFTAVYLRVVNPGNVRDLLSTLLCVGLLLAFMAGSTGWLVIIALICDKREKKGADHG